MARKQQDAPGRLEAVRGFVNTWDKEHEVEELTDPSALKAWLTGEELLEPGAKVGEADLRRALEVREALRAQLMANNGAKPDPGAVATLHAAAERAGIVLSFSPEGSTLEPASGGVDGAIGRLLTFVHEAEHDGHWTRLKACPWDTCNWAFYDNTKNGSGVWCNMAVCGNRAKARAYRERHAHPHG
jgi:predicted RNA-binding Zn ribbon-like protein